MSVADEIKARLDIVGYIQQYVPLKKSGRTFKACCPFHNEKTPSFHVNPDNQSWRCFGACADGGDVIAFAMKKHGWSFTEALHELGRQVGVEVRPQTAEQRAASDRLDRLRGLVAAAAEAYYRALIEPPNEQAAAARRYAVDKRRLSLDTIERFGLGYALSGWTHMLDYLHDLGYSHDQIIQAGLAIRSDEGRVYDRFRHRLMIPIRDERGRTVGFGARALDPDDEPKYLNSPQTPLFDKSRLLFAFDLAKTAIRESETAIIVEGYLDAITAHQAGFNNVVAQMGTSLTEMQLRAVARTARTILLALDSDVAGQNATRRSLEAARQALRADYSGRLSVDIRVLQIPGAKDPDDLIREAPEQWTALAAGALPVADYVIEQEMAALPPGPSLQQREAVARRLLPMLMASENDLYRQDNLQKLALRLRIPEADLLAWSAEQRRIAGARPPRPVAPAGPPPLDADRLEPPAYEAAPAAPSPLAPSSPSREAALEERSLRILLAHPDLFYQVNRKFRELAGGDRGLLEGPLRAWGAQDFSQDVYRALMAAFEAAFGQDELELRAYLRANLDDELRGYLETLLAEDLDTIRARLGYTMMAELEICWNRSRRSGPVIDPASELVDTALRLRKRRLQRERSDLYFLQQDSQLSADADALQMVGRQVELSNRATRLINQELARAASLLRNPL